jgi:malate dehydrogenase (oxaloacetate-decarboxylating)
VAVDVINTATSEGIAQVEVDDPIEAVHEAMWTPDYLPIKR